MGITLTFGLLGLLLGLKISSRLGAAFLAFSAVVCVHVLFATGPKLLHGSEYGRRLAAGLYRISQDGAGSLLNMTGAALCGIALAMLLHFLSEDRRARRWDPDRLTRRRVRTPHA